MSDSRYLTMLELAAELRQTVTCKNPYRAAWMWCRRNKVPTDRIGGKVLVLRVSLEEARKRGQDARRRRALEVVRRKASA